MDHGRSLNDQGTSERVDADDPNHEVNEDDVQEVGH
jgi:hypothetical protein